MSIPQLNIHLNVWRLNDLSTQQSEKSHLKFLYTGFILNSSLSIIYLSNSKSFKVRICHHQRHLKSFTRKINFELKKQSILNVIFRIVFKNKLSFRSSVILVKKYSISPPFTMTLSKKQWFPKGHFPILLV